ncbi:MAG TPA: UPF0175 family protein [Thermoanaerobaculia bacterium]|nr:UPF0175 family protein [Thermoanaerobaculia bacterium]
MEITIQVPDSLADRLRASWQDLPRHALEALAADAYRQGLLTAAEVQEVLGIASRYELDGFLKQAGAFLQYTAQDLEEDVRSFLEKPGG